MTEQEVIIEMNDSAVWTLNNGRHCIIYRGHRIIGVGYTWLMALNDVLINGKWDKESLKNSNHYFIA